MQNDRRTQPNEPVAEAVDATVDLMPHISRYQAALVMARDGVPTRVIRRVLDEPAQRRAADKAENKRDSQNGKQPCSSATGAAEEEGQGSVP